MASRRADTVPLLNFNGSPVIVVSSKHTVLDDGDTCFAIALFVLGLRCFESVVLLVSCVHLSDEGVVSIEFFRSRTQQAISFFGTFFVASLRKLLVIGTPQE